jgi:toxin ParE1/3/4
MLDLRINPLVAEDLKEVYDFIACDNEENAAKTVEKIYKRFENLQLFPGMGADLSKRINMVTDYKYVIWEDYVIIYKYDDKFVEIYRVINTYRDITRIFN